MNEFYDDLLHPGGMPEISRGSSAATPPVKAVKRIHPGGMTELKCALLSHREYVANFLAPLQGNGTDLRKRCLRGAHSALPWTRKSRCLFGMIDNPISIIPTIKKQGSSSPPPLSSEEREDLFLSGGISRDGIYHTNQSHQKTCL